MKLFGKSEWKRIVFGWILCLTAVGGVMAGGLLFSVLLGIGCVLGAKEFITMSRAKGYKPSARIVYGMTIAFMVLASLPKFPGVHLPETFPLSHYPIVLTVGLCISFFRLVLRNEKPPATIADIASTIMGFLYVGWMPSHLILLRNIGPAGSETITNPLQQPGLAYLWVSLFIIWATDVMAYYFGKKLGKTPLHPEISPKKTVEGALGGLLSAVFWATFVVYVADNFLFPCHPFQFNLLQAPIMGFVVSIAAQLGDLAESLIKRDAGMKDSSDMIPGHGGFLDRGDSLLFGGPICFYWIKIVVLGIL